jgi:hypothetical protein
MGFFDGTIERRHLDHSSVPKVGDRIKARILYDIVGSPPRFALSCLSRIVSGDLPKSENMSFWEKYPAGTILEEVKVQETEAERGLYAEVQPGLSAFVHVSLMDTRAVTY